MLTGRPDAGLIPPVDLPVLLLGPPFDLRIRLFQPFGHRLGILPVGLPHRFLRREAPPPQILATVRIGKRMPICCLINSCYCRGLAHYVLLPRGANWSRHKPLDSSAGCVSSRHRVEPSYTLRYRCTEVTIPGNMKLAQAAPDAKGKPTRITLIETRGEGGPGPCPRRPPAGPWERTPLPPRRRVAAD